MNSVMRRYRLKSKLMQTTLGDMVGLPSDTIWRIENRSQPCDKQIAVAIARVLRCNVDTLFRPVVERKTRYMVRRGR